MAKFYDYGMRDSGGLSIKANAYNNGQGDIILQIDDIEYLEDGPGRFVTLNLREAKELVSALTNSLEREISALAS